MEQRLSHGWADTAWHCTASACYSAGMECEPEYIPGGRKSVGLTGALKIKGVPFLLLGFSLTVLQKLRLCSGQVPIC